MTSISKHAIHDPKHQALIENYLDIRAQYTTLATASQRLGVGETHLQAVLAAFRNAGDPRLAPERRDNDYTELDTSSPAVANVKIEEVHRHKALRGAANLAVDQADLRNLLGALGLDQPVPCYGVAGARKHCGNLVPAHTALCGDCEAEAGVR